MKKQLLIAAVAGVVAACALVVPGLASSRDSNQDQIPDRWEKRFHLSLKVDQANRDQDRDDLDNMCEFEHGDSPRDADSDDDGAEDRDEPGEHRCGRDEDDGPDDHGNQGPGGDDHS